MDKAPLWKRGVRGDLKGAMLRYNKSQTKRYLRIHRVFLKNMRVFVILKISLNPSFPKRVFRVSTEKSEEPKVKSYKLSRFL